MTGQTTGARHWRNAGTVGGVRPIRGHVGPMAKPAGVGKPVPFVLPPYFAPAPAGYNVLPYNTASAETDASGWSAVSGGSVAQSTTYAYDGTHSLAATCSATTTVVQCSPAHVWPGVTYYPQVQALATVSGCAVAVEVDYLDASGNVLASFTSVASPVRYDGAWGVIVGPACVAPSGAATGRLKLTVTSPGSTTVYLDAAYLGACQDPPAFTSNTYLSFDPPSSTSPNWIDITQLVEIDTAAITIQHGRQDGLSDVNSGSLAFTADNSDGRWFTSNPNGAWYGGIRKGAWVRQTHTFDGVERNRFIGFLTGLPKQGLGAYQTVQITATDWLGHLGQHNALSTAVFHEQMQDAAGLPAPWAYYALNEQAASTAGVGQSGSTTTANDSSGYASQLGRAFPLIPTPTNVAGGAISWAQSAGPGFDGDQAISFAPASTTSGYTLRGQLARNLGANWLIRFWFKTSTANQQILTLADYSPGAQGELIFGLDSAGYFSVISQGTAANAPWTSLQISWSSQAGVSGPEYPTLADGVWHLVSIYGFPSPADQTQTRIQVNFDGSPYAAYNDLPGPKTLQSITVGGWDDVLRLGAGNVGLYTGAIYGLSIADMTSWPAGQFPFSSCTTLYKTGATGNAGETTGARLSRIARYAGVPSAWTNFDTGISQVGAQSYTGRYPLDVMRECARTEGMPLYCATDGRITMLPRTARFNPSAAWSHSASDLDPSSVFNDDFSYLINQAQMSRVGGSTITVNGAKGLASQAKYGLYYTSQQTAAVDDTNLVNLGTWILLGTSDPTDRFQPVVEYAGLAATPSPLAISAGWGSALYQAVLAADLSTHFTITGMPSNTPSPTLTQVIEGWAESITAATHTFTWNTTVPFATGIFQLDVSPYNQLDAGNILAY